MMTASYYRWLIYSFPKCPRLLLSLSQFHIQFTWPSAISIVRLSSARPELGNWKLETGECERSNGHRNIALNIIVVLLMFILRKNQVK
jgi:hypothetical protein